MLFTTCFIEQSQQTAKNVCMDVSTQVQSPPSEHQA